ncbi:hypothetical protein G6F56_001091 [Rhizopus delemar]|nr:hypothetical protein G6F56_001091 [Rhizopus delemar]
MMIATHRNPLNETNNVRQKSFSSMMKNLLSLVSRSDNNNSTTQIEDSEKRSQHVQTLFESMYFSFPAFEEQDENTSTGISNCHPQSPLIVGSNRIMC